MSKDYAADRAKMRSDQIRRAQGILTPEEQSREAKRRADAQTKRAKAEAESRRLAARGRSLFEGVEP